MKEENIVLGIKINKKKMLVNFISLSLVQGMIIFVGLFNLLKTYLMLNNIEIIFISMIVFIVAEIFFLSLSGSSEYLEIKNKKLGYYRTNSGLKGVLQLLKTNNSADNIFLLDMEHISLIKISYVKTTGGWAQNGYAIQLTFLLTDYSQFTIVPTTMNAIEDGTYKAFIDYIEQCGITVIDKYNICSLLSGNVDSFNTYIKELERGMKHD